MERVIMDEIPELTPQVEEAYKTLRTNIQFSGEDIKTISFTSCIPNEGKSIVTLQLAKSMAELGKKVLFLDADILALLWEADLTSEEQLMNFQ